ncbi:MAG: MMPL family transporter [Actinomycetota bacterium]
MLPVKKIVKVPTTGQSIFAQLGRITYYYRGWVILIWGLLVLLSLALTPRLDSVLKGTGSIYEGGKANQAEKLLKQELNVDANALTVVFQSSEKDAFQNSETTVQRIFEQVRNLPSVAAVASAVEHPEYRSEDGHTQYAALNLKVSGSEAFPIIDSIEQILNQNSTQNLKTFLTGKLVVDWNAQRISKEDLGRAELFALPLTLVALWFVFGSVVAAGMPVAIGLVTVSVTLGLLYLLTFKLSVSIFALNITTMLGLGLGIDYSLLIVNRFREELTTGSVEQAVIRTVDTAGRAVFFSGLTVCIGLACLLLFPILLLQSLGVAGSLVVLLSVAAALTLQPALLGLIGHRINRKQRLAQPPPPSSNFWGATARSVIRYSLVAVAVVLAIVVGLTSPFLGVRFGLVDAKILPKSDPAREGVEVLEQAFGSEELTPILLAVSTQSAGDRILSHPHLETLDRWVTELQADSRVAKVRSLVNIDPKLNLEAYQQLYRAPELIPIPNLATALKQLSSDSTTLIVVKSRTASNAPASRALVTELRKRSLEGLQIQVAGQTASELDTLQALYERIPVVLAAMMTVTFVVLCILLNSVILPLKAIVMNLLSIGASFGALVFIFQEGHFQEWLNFTPVGYIDILLPVVLFCALFGLSMDYEVFLLTRIKEAHDRDISNTASVIEGLERTGSIITSAAMLMIIVTGAFALTRIIFVKALGLGIATAVLIDATLIRAILVPATMQLMGKWNWWAPKFLGLDRISLKLD